MKKLLSLLLCLVMVLCAFAGCEEALAPAAQAPASETEEKAMPTIEKPATIDVQEFVAGESNGGWAMVAAAIADKANAYFNNFPITAIPGGSVANPAVMMTGDAQIGLTQGLFLNKLLARESPYEEIEESEISLQAIASLDCTCMYFIVDGDCPYNTLGELIKSGDKIKVGAFPASGSSSIAAVMLLQEYGLSAVADLQPEGTSVYVADGGSLNEAYGDHHFDMLINNTSSSNASLKELLSKRKSKILAIDEEVIASLGEKYGWSPVTIVGGTYENNPNDIPSVGFKSILVVRSDVPEELAYVLAKVCAEEKSYLETIQASYKAFDVSDMVKSTVVPFHPGAEKYWKEAGYID